MSSVNCRTEYVVNERYSPSNGIVHECLPDKLIGAEIDRSANELIVNRWIQNYIDRTYLLFIAGLTVVYGRWLGTRLF